MTRDLTSYFQSDQFYSGTVPEYCVFVEVSISRRQAVSTARNSGWVVERGPSPGRCHRAHHRYAPSESTFLLEMRS